MMQDNTMNCVSPDHSKLKTTAARHVGFIIEDYKNNGQETLGIYSWEAKAIHLFSKLEDTKLIIKNGLTAAGLRIIRASEQEVIIGKL